jgi:hypothetical protein
MPALQLLRKRVKANPRRKTDPWRSPWALVNHIVLAVSSILNWIYFVWVFHRLFREQEKQTIVRGIGTQAIGVTTYGCLIMIVAVILMFVFLV